MSGPGGSSPPAWKKALIDRKRRPEDPEAASVKVDPTGPPSTTKDHSSSNDTGSTWKQTTIGKKLQKYATPSDHDKRVPSRASEGTHSVGESPEIGVGSTGSSMGDEHLVEDRLLPIKQNPILVSDRQKRNKVKPKGPKTEGRSEKRSTSPQSSSKVPGPDANKEDPASHITSPTSSNQKPGGDDSADEVFDEEVTYGKGFVHRLLQKFINLSGKDEPAPAVGSTKPLGRVRSSGENHGGKTRSSSQYSNCDGEENGASRSPEYAGTDSSMQKGKTAEVSTNKTPFDTGSKVDGEQHASQSLIDAEELPQNSVSATRDIFERSGLAARKKPANVEKIYSEQANERVTSKKPANVEKIYSEQANERVTSKKPAYVEKIYADQANERVTLKKRPAPGIPPAATAAPLQTTEMLKNTAILSQDAVSAVSMETPSGVMATTKSDPQMKSQQSFPTNRTFYSAPGTKKTPAQENPAQRTQIATSESVTNAKEKAESSRSVAPSRRTDMKDNFSDHSVEVTKPNVENGVSSTAGKVSSLVGSWGTKNSSRAYDAKADDDEGVSFEGQSTEPLSAKVKQMQDLFAETSNSNHHSKSSSRVDVGISSSSNRETTNADLGKTPRFVGNTSSGTKVKIDPPSGNLDPVQTGQNKVSQDSNRSTSGEASVDIFKDLNHDGQREVEKNLEIDRMTTRIRVGGYPAPPLPQTSPSGGAMLSNSASTMSSIHSENQVTVIKIEGGAQPSTFQDKMENGHEHTTQPIERHERETGDAFENLQNNIISERKSTRITVGYDENTSSDIVNNSNKNASYEFDVSQNNMKNAVRNKVNTSDNSWKDPFGKSPSKSNGAGTKSDSKSPGVSRPGKLLIRPASNHPASKTRTEFLTLTKFNDIKKGEFAPARRPVVNSDELVNGDGVDRGRSPVDDLELPVFVGGGVSVGRSMLAKTRQGKKLRINFNDSALQTHEYQSEQSLMAEFPPEPGYCDYPEDEVGNSDLISSSGLSSSPAFTAGGQKLSSYTPRSQVEYAFGMDRLEDMESSEVDPEPQSLLQTNGLDLTHDSSDNTTYSKDISADLLF